MSKRLLRACLYMLCVFSFSLSCKKNPDTNTSIPGDAFPIPAVSPVTGSLSGRILDENNGPIPMADVRCGGLSTVTDADGFFNFKHVPMDKYISTVTASTSGYFKAYRSFSANATRNFVSIKMVPRIMSGSFSTDVGGIIPLSNSTEIDFQPNSIVLQAGGAPYNGTVNVFASYINPRDADISSLVPGSFMGHDNDHLYSLQSTGMIAVDIQSTTGELLQLAPGKPATIKLPIPPSLVSAAPANIDTWSLDDQGVWKKEGAAVKSVDHYEFATTHFSFWNCDVPVNAVYLSLHLQDNNGTSLANTNVALSIAGTNTWPSSTFGLTDAQGNVSGLVPAGYDIQLQIYQGVNVSACTTALYSQSIGSFTTSAAITVNATLSSQQYLDNIITVSGVANDCNGMPLQSGTVLIHNDRYFTYADVINGSYTAMITHCDPVPSLTIRIWDNNGTAVSTPVAAAVSGSTLTVPVITLGCGLVLNALDGIYQVTGTFTDALNASYAIDYPQQYYLVTNSPSSVVVARSINGEIIPGILFSNGMGSSSYYGSFGIQASFDLTNNTITELHNYYGDPANPLTQVGDPSLGSGAPNYNSGAPTIRSATLDPSGLNHYDPVARVIRIKYSMYQSTFTSGPRSTFDETWTYVGPR